MLLVSHDTLNIAQSSKQKVAVDLADMTPTKLSKLKKATLFWLVNIQSKEINLNLLICQANFRRYATTDR
ncbi:unnamed protein product [Coffea canephora]|uniref:Uncharacterized protein n=1 Tax=Coffea canephora TaxID=49390 RepID=A0A068V778_COFCA|nr:unnamed protein product [Coffea canephora]